MCGNGIAKRSYGLDVYKKLHFCNYDITCDNTYILHSKSTRKFVGVVSSLPMWWFKTSVASTTPFGQSKWTWSLQLRIIYHWWNFGRTLQHFIMQHTRHATIYYSMDSSPSKLTQCKTTWLESWRFYMHCQWTCTPF
jgi:hypothetical protein